MRVRRAIEGDASEVSRLFYDTVRKVNKADYCPEQIEAWAPCVREDAYWSARWTAEYEAWVVQSESGIRGFFELRDDGGIGCFYVHCLHQGEGIGTVLFRELQARAKAKGIRRLFADVSITAKPFFLAQGFQIIRNRMKLSNGCSFQIYEMEKELPS